MKKKNTHTKHNNGLNYFNKISHMGTQLVLFFGREKCGIYIKINYNKSFFFDSIEFNDDIFMKKS